MPLVTRQASSNDALDAATILQNLERLNETVERSSSTTTDRQCNNRV